MANNAECPHLTGKYMKSCTVSKEVYVPSAFETEEYRTHGRHTICPLYCRRTFDQYPAGQKKLAGAYS